MDHQRWEGKDCWHLWRLLGKYSKHGLGPEHLMCWSLVSRFLNSNLWFFFFCYGLGCQAESSWWLCWRPAILSWLQYPYSRHHFLLKALGHCMLCVIHGVIEDSHRDNLNRPWEVEEMEVEWLVQGDVTGRPIAFSWCHMVSFHCGPSADTTHSLWLVRKLSQQVHFRAPTEIRGTYPCEHRSIRHSLPCQTQVDEFYLLQNH